MSRITDDRLTELLKALPRREASSGFTREVLKRLERRAKAPRPRRRFVQIVAGATVLVLIGLSIGAYRRQQSDRLREVEHIESLRTEYRELETEVEQLRKLAREIDPVLDLGGNEQVDFVFDLRELAKRDNRSGVRPVSSTSGEKQ